MTWAWARGCTVAVNDGPGPDWKISLTLQLSSFVSFDVYACNLVVFRSLISDKFDRSLQ